MKSKKVIIGILLLLVVLVVFIKSGNQSADVSIKIDSIEETDEVESMDWSYEGQYVKVNLTITNKTKKPIAYLNSQLTNSSGKNWKEETVMMNSEDNMLAYLSTIQPGETLSGCVYFKTSYEAKMKLKTQILYNIKAEGSGLNGDTKDYEMELKK